jgi:hypothetical protein
MPQPITTKLTRGGQVLPAGPPIPIADDGTSLEIAVPAGLELSDAKLVVQVPDDSAPIDLLAGAAVTVSNGALAWPDAGTLSWVSFDWRARRALVRLDIKVTSTATHLRIRTSDGGPWMLAAPVSLAPFTNNVASLLLPGLAASRVMLELVRKPGSPLSPEDYTPETGVINTLTLTGSRRPPALTVSVGPRTVVRHEPNLLPPAATLTLREPLLAALRTALPGRSGGATQIVLRSPVLAALQRLELTLSGRPEVDRFRGDRAALELTLEPDREQVATIDLGVKSITAFSLRVRPDLRPELPSPVPPPANPPAYAHRCSPDSALAQSFVFAGPGQLVGVDLLLAVRSPTLTGRISIHADEHGAPAEPPLATLKLELSASDPPGVLRTHRWSSFDLPAPVAVAPDVPLWLSLIVDAGEALWALDARPAATPARALLRRDRAAAWVARDMSFPTGPQIVWAVARPRLRNDGPPLAPALTLRRQGKTLTLLADAAGRVRVDAAALAPLDATDPAAPLELVIRSPGAGRALLDDLHVELPAQTTVWPYPPPP